MHRHTHTTTKTHFKVKKDKKLSHNNIVLKTEQNRRSEMCSRMRGGENEIKKGPWKTDEDEVLINHVNKCGPRDWSSIRSKGLLRRTGKSCRLRWVNKLRPNLKNGCKFSLDEERVVIELQGQFGNKWARIATYLPGRTDNDVKNFWSSRKKRLARLHTTSSSSSSSSSKHKKQNHHHHRNNNNNSAEDEDPFIPLTWQVGNEASSLDQIQQSLLPEHRSEGLLDLSLTDPSSTSCLTNYNYNLFEPDMTTTMAPDMMISMMNVDCPAAHFPIQVPFDNPTMPVLPLPLSPESQELIARLENGGLMNEFGPEQDGVEDAADMDMSSMMMMMMPPGPEDCSNNDLAAAAPDSFFDDFPTDMFDHIESLPSPSHW